MVTHSSHVMITFQYHRFCSKKYCQKMSVLTFSYTHTATLSGSNIVCETFLTLNQCVLKRK